MLIGYALYKQHQKKGRKKTGKSIEYKGTTNAEENNVSPPHFPRRSTRERKIPSKLANTFLG